MSGLQNKHQHTPECSSVHSRSKLMLPVLSLDYLGQCRESAKHAAVCAEALEVEDEDRGTAVEGELLGSLHPPSLTCLAVIPLIGFQLFHFSKCI